MISKFDNIWYSTEERAKKSNPGIVYDQVCSLIIKNNHIVLLNNDFSLVITNVKSIKLGNRKFNWWLLLNIPIIFFITYASAYFNPIKNFGVVLGVILLPTITFILIKVAISKWIIVEGYVDGNQKNIYLCDGSNMGWSGMFGGTKKLYKYLKNIY